MDSKKFSELEEAIHKERDKLDEYFLKVSDCHGDLPVGLFNETNLQGSKFFSKFESFLSSISSASEELSKTQVEDVLTSIENVLDYSIVYWHVMRASSKGILSCTISPEPNFLKTSQQIFRTYKKEKALALRMKFLENGLPTEGFDSKGSYKLTSMKIDWVSLVIGLVLLAISGGLVFVIDIDTGMEYFFSRILISLAIALVFTGIAKEKIQAKIKVPGVIITAFGTVAIFFVLYFANPADMPKLQSENVNISDTSM